MAVPSLLRNHVFQSVLSGLLGYLSFTEYFFFLIFIAFVPLFLMSADFYQNRISGLKFILLSFLSFLLWNALTTWWISRASIGGAAMAIVCNSILMCIVFTVPFFLQKKFRKIFQIGWIIPFWLSFEYLHVHWDLMWPWLTLGHVFAFAPWMVQWYELIGTTGGSFWVLLVNVLFTNYFLSDRNYYQNFHKTYIRHVFLFFVLPILLSVFIYLIRYSYWNTESKKFLNVLIVQPNVDPYNDKFYLEPLTQVYSAYQQIKPFLKDHIDVIVFPETFITENIYEGPSSEMLEHSTLKFLHDSILQKHPNISIITGANTFKVYKSNEDIPATARKSKEGLYYDVFNTALCMYKDSVQIYHKSKLVPGVEKMPYPSLFKPLESLAIDLGGTTGSLGKQDQPSLLYIHNTLPVATVICYESIFSDFVSRFFRIGAQSLFVITNDGWWGHTPGYHQHLLFGRLRAIENRTYIVRSANTGVSAVINPLGEIEKQTSFWTKDILLAKIPYPSDGTLYSKTGDILSWFFMGVLGLIFLFLFTKVSDRKYL